jgi:nicotinamidase-related amidase
MIFMSSGLVLIDLMPRIVALPLAPRPGEDVLDRCRALAAAFRAQGRPVVLVRVERPNVARQPAGSELAPGLEEPGDIVVVKRTIGAFHDTDLDARLRERGLTTLVFGGLVTSMGVESTARAASDHGYDLEFVADAMSDRTAEEHDFAVRRTFPRFGTVRNTADYL